MHRYEDFEWTAADTLASQTRSETPWRFHEQTAVYFDSANRSGQVVPIVEGAGEDNPPLGALHVVTAIQPSTDPRAIDNVNRTEVLDNELGAAGLQVLPAVGASTDGTYSEDSRAVFGLSDDDARQLGLRFGQVAVFAWRGPRWSLLACSTDRVTHRGWRWISQPK